MCQRDVSCRFEIAVEYSLKSLPLDYQLLKAATFINFDQRVNADPLHADFFMNRYRFIPLCKHKGDCCFHTISRFSDLLPYSSPSELTELGEEFVDYQLLRDEDIPAHVWNDARIEPREEGGNCHHRMDTLWHYLSTLRSGDGYQRFQKLSKIAMLVLVIPHSNADEERVFPWYGKQNTILP